VKEFDEELKDIKKKGLLRKLTCAERSKNAKIFIRGQQYLNFSSNDYLGISQHPQIIRTAITALKKYGFGSGASRLLSGSYTSHRLLEQKIAKFKKTQKALVFNSGYSANTGIIPTLARAEYTIFSDELNHASIIDGTRLSKARARIYRHKDVVHLEKLLKQTTGKKLIITDTVFSMDGDIAPLADIAFLAKKYKSLLMIDDAHGTGVLGKSGRGGLEHFGIKGDDIIQMGTLSKACGCIGGFVTGTQDLIEFFINKARSFIYTTSLPPAVAEACSKAIEIVQSESYLLRKGLWKNRQKLSDGLEKLGYDTLGSETPIVPVLTGDIKTSLKINAYLYQRKIFAPVIRPPTVPEGKCRIRFSVTAAHTESDIERVLESLKKWKDIS
jgi:glycine C-acetyltransferase